MINKSDEDEEIIRLVSEMEDEEELDPAELRKKKRAEKKAKKEEAEKAKTPLRVLLDYLIVIAIGIGVAFLLCKFVIINAEVPTSSMVPTINVKDRMIGLRVTYYFSDPKRGDVVIFKCPDPTPEYYDKLFVKRVIGLPGETVTIKAGEVWITPADGGEPFRLQEDYLNEVPKADISQNNSEYVLGDDEYFMMGDNRNYSLDSRYWGNVSRDRILAKVLFKYYKGFEVIK